LKPYTSKVKKPTHTHTQNKKKLFPRTGPPC